MFLIYNVETKTSQLVESVEGVKLKDSDHIELHGDKKRGRLLVKEKGKKQAKLKDSDYELPA